MNGAQAEIERAFGWRDAGTLLAFIWASIIATLVASAVATVFFLVITAGPIGLMSLLTIVVPIAGMMKASVHVLPLTFFALPIAAVLLPVRRREWLLYILPAVGCAGGALIMAVQAPLAIFVATGAIGGFAAGIVYARRIAILAVPRLPYVTAANAAIAARLTLRGLGYCGLYAVIGAIPPLYPARFSFSSPGWGRPACSPSPSCLLSRILDSQSDLRCRCRSPLSCCRC